LRHAEVTRAEEFGSDEGGEVEVSVEGGGMRDE
jgi:hypothetical protein